jgi:hypothetical protein
LAQDLIWDVPENREVSMRLRQIMLAGSTAVILMGTAPAWADQTLSGLVTVVDRTTGEIVVKKDDGGTTVGSGAAAATEKFKMRDGIPESLHAGEKVTITYTESAGVKTATKVDETKN